MTAPDACECQEPVAVPPIGNPHSPPYRRDAVSLGPFEDEPLGLRRIVGHRADGTAADDESGEVSSNSAAWLVGALEASGVELGEFDRYLAALIAHDGWSLVQVVAGWVARAHRTPESAS